MRILDQDSDRALARVTLYLTSSEAAEMRDSLASLLQDPAGRHEHVASEDYAKEVTLCVYTPGESEGFSERSRTLINDDA